MGPEHPRANCLGGWGTIGPVELVIVILCCRIHSYCDFYRLWYGKEMCYTGIQVKWVGIVHCATSFSQLSAFFSCYVGRRQDNWISLLVELEAAFFCQIIKLVSLFFSWPMIGWLCNILQLTACLLLLLVGWWGLSLLDSGNCRFLLISCKNLFCLISSLTKITHRKS